MKKLTPYYQRDNITIFCGETLATMARLAILFHAVIADLPYGTTACSWDTVIPFEPLWQQYKRLTTGAVVLFGSQPFTSALVMSCPEWFKYEWVWEKTRPSGFAHAKNAPMKTHENICVFSKGGIAHASQGKSRMIYNPQGIIQINEAQFRPSRKNGSIVALGDRPSLKTKWTKTHENYPRSVLRIANPNYKPLHPTQKPVALLAYLIRTYTNPGEIVLDNTMGSGTTLVAAQREGRQAVGIDDKEEYCKIAVERLRQPTFWSLPSEPAQAVKVEQATLL